MALPDKKTVRIGNELLDKWEFIGVGGFGFVYKARYSLGFDVAIKIPRPPETTDVYQEALHMETVSCQFVLRLYGLYEGCPPFRGSAFQSGIVMEYMGGGSIESLLKKLSGPPPWPLAFRMAHEVALGMNFLQSKKIVHKDLKPSNILLSDNLNAKITDFGLSSVSTSALSSNNQMTGPSGGTYKYKPPEAFEPSYKYVSAFDRYSYAILLWSILTGQEPYPAADEKSVQRMVPKGARPSCEDIDQTKAEGLGELVDLMKRCWDKDPPKRPKFEDCCKVTEHVYLKHKNGIIGAVYQVLTRQESPQINQVPQMVAEVSFTPQTPGQSESSDTMDGTPTPMASLQCDHAFSTKDKAKFVDENVLELIQTVGETEVMAITKELTNKKMVHREAHSSISAEPKLQEKVRLLYDGPLHSGGEKVKAAFYDALKKHDPQLVKRLGGS